MDRSTSSIARATLGLLVCGVMAVGVPVVLSGCQSDSASAKSDLSAGYKAPSGSGAEGDGVLHGNMPDLDDNALVVRTSGGTTSEDKVPEVKLASNSTVSPITIITTGFSTSRDIFIYVDRSLVIRTAATDSEEAYNLRGSMLDGGVHTIEAIQYAGDDPTGTATLYRVAHYRVAS